MCHWSAGWVVTDRAAKQRLLGLRWSRTTTQTSHGKDNWDFKLTVTGNTVTTGDSRSCLRCRLSCDISTIPKEVLEQKYAFCWAGAPRPCCIPGVSRPAHVATPRQEAWAVLPPQPPDTGPPELEAWELLPGQPPMIELYQNYKSHQVISGFPVLCSVMGNMQVWRDFVRPPCCGARSQKVSGAANCQGFQALLFSRREPD